MISNTKWFLGVILLSVQAVYSQNSFIEFLSEVETPVIVYRPIDNGHNEYYPTDTIQLKTNNIYRYTLSVKDWCVVRCQFPRKAKLDIFIQTNETVRINNAKQDIVFEGNNAAANNFSNKNMPQKSQRIKFLIDSIFNKVDKESIEQIIQDTKSLFQDAGLFYDIDSMYINKKISKSCNAYLNKDLKYRIAYNLMKKNDIFSANKSSRNDSLKNYMDGITKYITIDGNMSAYPYGKYFANSYYFYVYGQLNQKDKDNLVKNDDTKIFGPYLRYLLMPEKTQLSLFFDVFTLQYIYGVNEFDRLKLYNYLKDNYPTTEAVKIIKKYIDEELKDSVPLNIEYIDNQLIKNISDICKIEQFRSKYLFIDIWASWCLPCRAEFSHNKKLNEVLAKYPNVEKLYVSIDDNIINWKDAIKTMRLSGYHLLATTQLIEGLKKEIYNSAKFTVPRYILLSPEGTVINNNLSRPSSMDDLKVDLDKALTQ